MVYIKTPNIVEHVFSPSFLCFPCPIFISSSLVYVSFYMTTRFVPFLPPDLFPRQENEGREEKGLKEWKGKDVEKKERERRGLEGGQSNSSHFSYFSQVC